MKIPKLRKFDPIWIKWIDAGGINNNGWHDIVDWENEPPPTICETLGFFMVSTKDYIYIAQNYDAVDSTAVTNIERIPHGCIQKIKKIKI